jgi:hypothetical protein
MVRTRVGEITSNNTHSEGLLNAGSFILLHVRLQATASSGGKGGADEKTNSVYISASE